MMCATAGRVLPCVICILLQKVLEWFDDVDCHNQALAKAIKELHIWLLQQVEASACSVRIIGH